MNIGRVFSGNDFYEARSAGRVFNTFSSTGINGSFNSNNAKKYNGGAYLSMRFQDSYQGFGIGTGFYQNYRVNNKLSFGTEIMIEPRYNYVNWVGKNSSNEIIFSRYDRNTVESILDVKYAFTAKMGLNLRGRHYWSDRRNKSFFLLQDDGNLQPNPGTEFVNQHVNYNVFNIDMVYSWQFAPGSELSLTYKDVAEDYETLNREGYGRNFGRVISRPQNNSLSLKVLYYLDYLQLKKKN